MVVRTLHRSSVVSSMTDLQTFSTFGTQTLSNTVFVVGEQSLRYKWHNIQGDFIWKMQRIAKEYQYQHYNWNMSSFYLLLKTVRTWWLIFTKFVHSLISNIDTNSCIHILTDDFASANFINSDIFINDVNSKCLDHQKCYI